MTFKGTREGGHVKGQYDFVITDRLEMERERSLLFTRESISKKDIVVQSSVDQLCIICL